VMGTLSVKTHADALTTQLVHKLLKLLQADWDLRLVPGVDSHFAFEAVVGEPDCVNAEDAHRVQQIAKNVLCAAAFLHYPNRRVKLILKLSQDSAIHAHNSTSIAATDQYDYETVGLQSAAKGYTLQSGDFVFKINQITCYLYPEFGDLTASNLCLAVAANEREILQAD